jgi:hypothetical protein
LERTYTPVQDPSSVNEVFNNCNQAGREKEITSVKPFSLEAGRSFMEMVGYAVFISYPYTDII